jgi:hypothetical protein
MAAVGIVGLVLSFAAWGLGLRSTFGKAMLVVGLATLGLGIAGAIVGNEGSEVLLAVFLGGARRGVGGRVHVPRRPLRQGSTGPLSRESQGATTSVAP